MKDTCVILDLDGTLLDCRIRLYTLFKKLVPECYHSLTEYWDLKRQSIGHKKLLMELYRWDLPKFIEFEKRWLKQIEDKKYLTLDSTVEGIQSFLQNLKIHNYVVLLTARQKPEHVFWQLEKLSLLSFFDKILVTGVYMNKVKLLNTQFERNFLKVYMIGDTGEDIQIANQFGFFSVAVTNGFRNEAILKEYKPDLIISSVAEFKL